MASSISGHHLLYYTFEERGLKDTLQEFHKFLVENQITVGSVFKCLMKVSSSLFPCDVDDLPESYYDEDPEIKLPQLFNYLIENLN